MNIEKDFQNIKKKKLEYKKFMKVTQEDMKVQEEAAYAPPHEPKKKKIKKQYKEEKKQKR